MSKIPLSSRSLPRLWSPRVRYTSRPRVCIVPRQETGYLLEALQKSTGWIRAPTCSGRSYLGPMLPCSSSKFIAQKLRPIELDPFCTLFYQHNYKCRYFVCMEFPHELVGQQLGGNAHPSIFDTCYYVTSLSFLYLMFGLHSFWKAQVTTLSGDVCGIASFNQQLRYSVN